MLNLIDMRKERVNTVEKAFLYLIDCTLATVSDMALKKSKNKSELSRQIGIAQTGIDWVKQFKVEFDKDQFSRMVEVLELPDQSVETWAENEVIKYG